MQRLLQVLVWELELAPRRPQMPLAAQQCQLQQMLRHSLSNLMTGCGPLRAGQGTWQRTVLCCVRLGCRLMQMTGSTSSAEAGRAVALTCLARGWQFWRAHALACKSQTMCSLEAAWHSLHGCATLSSNLSRHSLLPLLNTGSAQHLNPNLYVALQAHSALS